MYESVTNHLLLHITAIKHLPDTLEQHARQPPFLALGEIYIRTTSGRKRWKEVRHTALNIYRRQDFNMSRYGSTRSALQHEYTLKTLYARKGRSTQRDQYRLSVQHIIRTYCLQGNEIERALVIFTSEHQNSNSSNTTLEDGNKHKKGNSISALLFILLFFPFLQFLKSRFYLSRERRLNATQSSLGDMRSEEVQSFKLNAPFCQCTRKSTRNKQGIFAKGRITG